MLISSSVQRRWNDSNDLCRITNHVSQSDCIHYFGIRIQLALRRCRICLVVSFRFGLLRVRKAWPSSSARLSIRLVCINVHIRQPRLLRHNHDPLHRKWHEQVNNFNCRYSWIRCQFVFNKQQLNFHRANYDVENWCSIIRVLNSESCYQIHVLNRAQLVVDALNFDGNIGFDIAFDILSYLEHETEYFPWAAASRNYLNRLDYLLLDSGVRETVHEFVNHLVARMLSFRSKDSSF